MQDIEVFSTNDYQRIKIEGYTNTWSAFETVNIKGKNYYIMENDEYGDETCYLIIEANKIDDIKIIGETFDDILTALSDYEIL